MNLLTASRWPDAFQISEEDRKRYGNNNIGISAILTRNRLAADAGTNYIHLCHPGWDHHVQIWDRKAGSNHYKLCAELDPVLSSLMEDLSTMKSKHGPSKTLLDETLVVVMSEFGRTPGAEQYGRARSLQSMLPRALRGRKCQSGQDPREHRCGRRESS